MERKVLYVINPQSNESRAQGNWNQIRKKYDFLPERPVDITQLSDVSGYIRDFAPDVIAIGGGDGTINAICKAILNFPVKPSLSILPLGFGNALSYCFGVETIDKAIETLRDSERTVTIDVLKTNVPPYEVAVFNMGIGFDARIVHSRMNNKYIGLRSYVLAAVRTFFSHPENEIKLTIDNVVTLRAKASSLVVANCPIIGHNYVVSPDARLNDGLLDCTLFSTKYAYLTNLRLRGFKHPLYSELGKVRFKASHIRIEGEPFVQIDGDPVVHTEGVEIEVLRDQVTFLRNSDDKIDQLYRPFI
jgi:diacylglycerol kinase (ATP)